VKTVKGDNGSAATITVKSSDVSLSSAVVTIQIGNIDTPIDADKAPDFIVNLKKNKAIPFDAILAKIKSPTSAAPSKKIVSEVKKFQKIAVDLTDIEVAQQWSSNPFLQVAINEELENR